MMVDTLWEQASQQVPLASGDIHLWRASLQPSASALHRQMALLSADELLRVQRLRNSAARDFAVARSTLRLILSRYLTCSPESIEFVYGDRGKPYLSSTTLAQYADGAQSSHIQFNVSHSGDVAVYAVTSHGTIGVDVECIRPVPHLMRLAQRYFSPQDCASLRDLTDQGQLQQFFHLWTEKEAYVKATGEGISGLSTAVRPVGWFFQSLQIEADVLVTVAASAATGQPRRYRWDHGG